VLLAQQSRPLADEHRGDFSPCMRPVRATI
jgi:hypothetical protein